MGMNELFINIALERFDNYRKGNASLVYDTVESITGNKPISFSQFAMDYAGDSDNQKLACKSLANSGTNDTYLKYF